jgi:hypothetical protein
MPLKRRGVSPEIPSVGEGHLLELAKLLSPARAVILLVRALLCLADFSSAPIHLERFLILVMLRAKLER